MTNNHIHNNLFSEILRTIYSQFQANHADADQEILLQRHGLNFLGVCMHLQDTLDPKRFRQAVEKLLDCEGFRLIQVIGDSGQGFTEPGCKAVKTIIEPIIFDSCDDNQRTVVEYGYTASPNDANWIVNDLLTANPHLAVRTVANVVHASATAIDNWHCEALANVRNFVLAYDDDLTQFGADTWLSDSIMTRQFNDLLICVEGGPQSFQQVVTVCKRGVSVILVTGSDLRPDGPSRFSAARLMKQLYEKWCTLRNGHVPSTEVKKALELLATEYLPSKVDLHSTQHRARVETILSSLKLLLEDPEIMKDIHFRIIEG